MDSFEQNVFRKNISILILGVEGVGKRVLGNHIADVGRESKKPRLNVVITLSKSIPDPQQYYDVVVLLIDLTISSSVRIFDSISKLADDVFVGKLCFAIVATTHRLQCNTRYDEIIDNITALDALVFHSPTKSDEDFRILATSIVKVARVNSGVIPSLTPCLFNHHTRIITPIDLNQEDTIVTSSSMRSENDDDMD